MRTISGKLISKIGIGSYGVGGLGHRDVSVHDKKEDQIYIEALVYTLEKGVNFSEISLGYGHGQALRLFKQALDKSTIGREDFFLTNSLYPRDLADISVIKQDVSDFYTVMQTDFADSTLVTQDLIIRFGEKEIYGLLEELLSSERTRFVSLSNASPNWIKKYKKQFGNKFVAHETHLSFEIRMTQDEGIFNVCDELKVTNIVWRPLRQNRTVQHNWPLLVELAKKYDKTQSQIVLNWICSMGCYPMVMSTNKKHIDENLQATEFEMSAADYTSITEFRLGNVKLPPVDWEGLKGGDNLVELANGLEEFLK